MTPFISAALSHNISLFTTPSLSLYLFFVFFSLFLIVIRQGLPFGPATLFDKNDDVSKNTVRGLTGDGVLEMVKIQTPGRHADSMESIFAQCMTLEVFPRCLYAFSAFHSGIGQLQIGPERRMLADCVLVSNCDGFSPREKWDYVGGPLPKREVSSDNVPSEIRFFNFDSISYHGSHPGEHLSGCVKNADRESVIDSPEEEEEEVVEEALRRMISIAASSIGEKESGKKIFTAPEFCKALDLLKVLYCSDMSQVFPDRLKLSFQSVHECQFFHTRGRDPEVLPWEKDEPGLIWDPKGLLLDRHPDDCVLGPGGEMGLSSQGTVTQKDLMRIIMNTGPDSDPSQSFSGFVCLTGGRESELDGGDNPWIARQFAFCHQRSSLNPETDLGRFTDYQADLMGDGRKKLENTLKSEVTLCRKSFGEEGVILGMDYLRFLVRERGLEGFDVKHVIFYRSRHFLSPYVNGLLQMRHDLRKDKDSGLLRDLTKLLLNGLYGYCAVESCNFSRGRIVSESTLRQMLYRDPPKGIDKANLVRSTILGSFQKPTPPPNPDPGPSAKKRRRMETVTAGPSTGCPELLYSLCLRNPKAKIDNVIHVASCILSHSRNLFLGKILQLLRLLDHRLVEIMYTGEE